MQALTCDSCGQHPALLPLEMVDQYRIDPEPRAEEPEWLKTMSRDRHAGFGEQLWMSHKRLTGSGVQLPDLFHQIGRIAADLTRYFMSTSCTETGQPLVSSRMMSQAVSAWYWVAVASGFRLPAPDAAPADDGHVFYVWDHDEHHLDVEVFPDGTMELFYRNRATEELLEDVVCVGETIPSGMCEKLRLLSDNPCQP